MYTLYSEKAKGIVQYMQRSHLDIVGSWPWLSNQILVQQAKEWLCLKTKTLEI